MRQGWLGILVAARRGWAAAGAVGVGTRCEHIAIMERRGLEKERAKGVVEPENS